MPPLQTSRELFSVDHFWRRNPSENQGGSDDGQIYGLLTTPDVAPSDVTVAFGDDLFEWVSTPTHHTLAHQRSGVDENDPANISTDLIDLQRVVHQSSVLDEHDPTSRYSDLQRQSSALTEHRGDFSSVIPVSDALPAERMDKEDTSKDSTGTHVNFGSIGSAFTLGTQAHSQDNTEHDGSVSGSSTCTSAERRSFVRKVSRHYVQLSTTHPICVASVGTVLAVFITAFGISTLPLTIDTSFETFLKTDVESSVMRDAFVVAMEAREKSRRLSRRALDPLINNRSDNMLWASSSMGNFGAQNHESSKRRLAGVVQKDLYVVYESRGEGLRGELFDEDALIAISIFEKELRELPKWKELCGRVDEEYRRLCKPGITFVNIAIPTQEHVRSSVVPDGLILDGRGSDLVPLQTSLLMAWRHGLKDIVLPKAVSEAPGAPESITSSGLLRSAFRFRLPVHDTMGVNDIASQWETLAHEALPLLREGCSCDKIKVYFEGTDMLGIQVKDALNSDIQLAACGAALVLLYLLLHTRSVVLSVMGLVLTMLSVPLSFICSALLAGTTTVSFASFLALFLVVGFGSDVIFVYTDFWRDSAVIFGNAEDRLRWTYKYASRASVATSATTALSFFANLASVIRALREFGFFMGFCVMTVWLLITTIYAPLCLIDEVYFKRYQLWDCWKRKKNTIEASMDCGETFGKQITMRAKRLGAWSAHLYRWRFSWCSIPISVSVVCGIVAMSSAKMRQGLPDIFRDDHNVVAGDMFMDKFLSPEDALPFAFKPPPEKEQVCSEQRFEHEVSSKCALYWCESSWSSTSDPDGRSCQCFRNNKTSPRCYSTDVEVIHRFVHPVGISIDQFVSSVTEYWKTGGLNGMGDISIPQRSSVKGSASPPILQHEWETGAVELGGVTETTTMLKKGLGATIEACALEYLCYCGELVCQMSGTWTEAPRVHLTGRALAVAFPSSHDDVGDRRLRSTFQERRLFMQPLPPGGFVNARRLGSAGNAIVQIGFGLKLQSSMPLLGSPQGSWEFLKDFNPSSPWAQRNLFTFCNFPAHFHIEIKRCWMEDFRKFLRQRHQRWPTLATDFELQALSFVATGSTRTAGTNYIWLYDTKIKAMMVAVEIGVPYSSPSDVVSQHKGHWDSYLEHFNRNSVPQVRGAIHTSSFWVAAEMQSALFAGTALTLLILLGLAFLGMLIFTGSLILSFFVVFSTILVIMMLAFYIVVLEGWEVGLIEVIAMVYFIGYAVTYSLHVAHKYAGRNALRDGSVPLEEMLENRNSTVRLQRTSFSLKAIGGAALGSAVTTAGTSFFLVFCELQIFTKLGCMCLAVTTMSIIMALGPLPAMLMIGGPLNPGHCSTMRLLFDRYRPKWMTARET